MKMRIGKYAISNSDPYGYVVAENVIRNREDETQYEDESFLGFYPCIEQCLKRVLELKIAKSDANSILELKRVVEEAKAEITKACKGQKLAEEDVFG